MKLGSWEAGVRGQKERRQRGHPLKGLSREKTALPPKKIHLFFACPLTFAPAQPRFITFFRTRYLFLIA